MNPPAVIGTEQMGGSVLGVARWVSLVRRIHLAQSYLAKVRAPAPQAAIVFDRLCGASHNLRRQAATEGAA